MELSRDLVTVVSRLKISMQKNPGHQRFDDSSVYLPKAAVGVILAPDIHRQELTALFVKRKTSATDHWSGHMAFPGGMMKNGENSLKTARREVLEETKIDLQKCEFIGCLNNLHTGNNSVVVSPLVFFTSAQISVTIQHREIEDYVWIPVSFFSEKSNIRMMQTEISGVRREFVSFPYKSKYVVWGMTLRVVCDMLDRM